MARPVAGVRKKTLIITLPGSPKGAKENLEAVLKLLPHACQQAAGANSRALHAGGVKKLEEHLHISSIGSESASMDLETFIYILSACYPFLYQRGSDHPHSSEH